MKNFKNTIIYSIIVLLCLGAFAGYIFKNKSSKPASSTDKPAVATKEGIKDADIGNVNEELAIGAKVSIVLVADGDNITGKSEEERNNHVKAVMDKAFAPIDPNPVVGIGRGEDYSKVTADAIQNAGGLQDIIKKGDVVLLKPNVCTEQYPGLSIITDYRVVQAVADQALQLGASRVIVAEGGFSGNTFTHKLNKYNNLKGVEFFNFNDCEKEDCYELKSQKSLVGKSLFIPKIYMDADVVINIAKLKTHSITAVSLSLKNCFGIPSCKIYGGVDKGGLHALGMEEAIIDLNRVRKPDLAIIDGIVGGEGVGPSANTPVNSNVVFAAKDLVALDTVALNFMGFKVNWVKHVERAEKEKLGISDVKKIKIVGADLDSIKMDFKSNEKKMYKILEESNKKQ